MIKSSSGFPQEPPSAHMSINSRLSHQTQLPRNQPTQTISKAVRSKRTDSLTLRLFVSLSLFVSFHCLCSGVTSLLMKLLRLARFPPCLVLVFPSLTPCPTQMEPSGHVYWTDLFSLPHNRHISDSLDFLPYNFKCFGALELTDVPCVCLYRQVPFVRWPCPQPSMWKPNTSLLSLPPREQRLRNQHLLNTY